MKKIILFFSLCLCCLSAFSTQAEGHPPSTCRENAPCSLAAFDQKKSNQELSNAEVVQEIQMIKKADLFIQKFAFYKIFPKSNDVSKYWQHCKMGGNLYVNITDGPRLRFT